MDSIELDTSNLTLSNEIRDKNLAPSTKTRYLNLFKHFNDWIRTNKADYCFIDGTISYADIDTDTFMEFFAEKIKSSSNIRKRTNTGDSIIVSDYNTTMLVDTRVQFYFTIKR